MIRNPTQAVGGVGDALFWNGNINIGFGGAIASVTTMQDTTGNPVIGWNRGFLGNYYSAWGQNNMDKSFLLPGFYRLLETGTSITFAWYGKVGFPDYQLVINVRTLDMATGLITAADPPLGFAIPFNVWLYPP